MGPETRLAVVKPDHLGDMVLASPAVRRLAQSFRDVTLFCHPGTAPLARFLFGVSVKYRDILFPCQSREKVVVERLPDPLDEDAFDLIISLRDDQQIADWLPGHRKVPTRMVKSRLWDSHEAWIQHELVENLTGQYRPEQYFFLREDRGFPSDPRKIGLSVAAGFATNKWPAASWIELAARLKSRGVETVWIGGPREAAEIHILQRLEGKSPSRSILGGSGFGQFLDQVAELDLVVATDSGTAHMCSTVVPMLSLFGPSPFRRYAPFGARNRLLTYDLSCSPCPQFDRYQLSLCLSRECLNAIHPETVVEVIYLDAGREPRMDDARFAPLKFYNGVSELAQVRGP
jgi:heptosyltransferase-2